MGYTTEFSGRIEIVQPLNVSEIAFLQKFNETRRMKRTLGPYYVDNPGFGGQDQLPDILDYNHPPDGQPSLWCQWRPDDTGHYPEWDGGEKFYEADVWMKYLIEHFLKPNPIAKPSQLPFLEGHILNGEITAQGEESHDRWILSVENNVVKVIPVELKAKRSKARRV